MGGAEILQYAARGPADVRTHIRGYVAESPYLALHPSSQPSRFVVAAGKLASRIVPKRKMVQKLDSKNLSRDPDVCKEWAEDELCHDTGTLEGLAGMLERGDELDRDVVVLEEGQGQGGTTTIWVGHGSDDRVTSYDTSKRWFERLAVKDKKFKTYEGWYHKCEPSFQVQEFDDEADIVQVHAEPGDDKITFANDVADWIIARSGPEIEDGLGAKSKL